MAYVKQTWLDGTVITSTALNNLENGVESAVVDAESALVAVGGKVGTSHLTDIAAHTTEFGNKVDKITGKGLSTNDFDNTQKTQITTNTADIFTINAMNLPGIYNSLLSEEQARITADANRYTKAESDISYAKALKSTVTSILPIAIADSENAYGNVLQIQGNTTMSVASPTPDNVATITGVGSSGSTNIVIYKNLFDKTKVTAGYYIITESGLLTADVTIAVSDYISVTAGVTYTKTTTNGYAFYDINKVYISGGAGGSILAPANATFIRLSVPNVSLDTCQFYNEARQTLTIPLATPLHRVGTSYDRIIKNGGVWGIERNVGVSNNLSGFSSVSGTGEEVNGYFRFSTQVAGMKYTPTIITNRFTFSPANLSTSPYSVEGVATHYQDIVYLYIRGDRAGLLTTDVAATKESKINTWRTTNPIKLYYPLATPTFTALPQATQDILNTLITTYNPVTNITSTDTVLPSVVFEYNVRSEFWGDCKLKIGTFAARPTGVQVAKTLYLSNDKIAGNVDRLSICDKNSSTWLQV